MTDNGCALAPDCFACPLDDCRWTWTGGIKPLKARRDEEIREAHVQGVTYEDLAQRFGMSVATVKRAMKGKGG